MKSVMWSFPEKRVGRDVVENPDTSGDSTELDTPDFEPGDNPDDVAKQKVDDLTDYGMTQGDTLDDVPKQKVDDRTDYDMTQGDDLTESDQYMDTDIPDSKDRILPSDYMGDPKKETTGGGGNSGWYEWFNPFAGGGNRKPKTKKKK